MATGERERSAFSQAVADQVRAERSALRLTQREFAGRAGIPPSTYAKLEAGQHVADASEIGRITDAIGLSLVEFFDRVQNRVAQTAARCAQDA